MNEAKSKQRCDLRQYLGTPEVPFCPFYFGVSFLKLNSRKKGTLIINGLLGNLGTCRAKTHPLNLSFASTFKWPPWGCIGVIEGIMEKKMETIIISFYRTFGVLASTF